ncbi:MAG: 30S ribosomal protein S5 [Candidatus Wildermuthbacteria bacterium RIFCSPHIGHO2_02_FULL_49_9]|uniref:Small ribosomal subunit protein uS5 n=2 Tax=Candidatus Wildermuthiibacteriota TaxID=1817923 RepID=A0A1G2QW96_9BACT|nr:MAG: 30S ribosomal protein S5 [Candidatus Wildermuthbacteria bacterium RIFCSPHIGHO2_01_FULL_49_22b]OHA70102.1 MAG: 30S ribosomal protein S5 [Candidatus Wildermuthbacteria bacterium RIFCSPHIGHO2_02_FULL_49_9]
MPREKSEFDSKLVDLARVTRVSAGGRRFRFRAVVIAGDRKSRVGVGVAKGADVAKAMEKATRRAVKNLVTVPMAQDTIPHEVEATFGASHVLLKPQKKGRGLVAGGVMRIIAEKAGLKNISAKTISKSRNKLNNALATLKALQKLRAQGKETAPQPLQESDAAKEEHADA